MNSPVEDRLREALAEAGATVDTGALRPLRAPERRWFRMDLRLVAVPVVVLLAGAAAVALGSGDEERATVASPGAATGDTTEMAVFLCAKSAPKQTGCKGPTTTEQMTAIERMLRELPKVTTVTFVNEAEAYRDFRAAFAHNDSVLESVKGTDVPASFRVKLGKGGTPQEMQRAFGKPAGVLNVVNLTSYAAAQKTMGEWHLSAFVCQKGTTLPACGGEQTRTKNGDIKATREGAEATDDERAAIEALIKRTPEVDHYVFEDQETAYRNFQDSYKNNKSLLQAATVDDMPEAFRIKLKQDAAPEALAKELRDQTGVAQVFNHRCLADRSMLLEDFGLMLPESKVCPTAK
ncbi:permease-like cell division protein FtsX [Nonomuraea sp. NPDC050643]|uniref:permease-like cell division protein FtsX n=1 Tax=Nonomuraea sp. NPDC050643 TaxID=3155660 RepID=UPI0033CE45CA